jgi:hypothetical protein
VDFGRHANPIDDPENPLGPSAVQPETVEPPPTLSAPETSDSALANALTLLSQSIRQSNTSTKPSRTKIREPDSYDGSDPLKLKDFLVQCHLNFLDRPSAFISDRNKVNYSISFLRGNALSWFEPNLLEEQQSGMITPIFEDYDLFVEELKANFGPHDPIGAAESELETLRMKDTQRITKYLVLFNKLASQTGWESKSLRHAFYRGLPDRIKDEISRIGKPESLLGMKDLAQKVDSRFWERKSEVSREPTRPQQSSSSKTSSTSQPSSSKSSDPVSSKQPSKTPPKQSFNPPTTPKSRPDLSDKIGKDGKLTASERKRRFDNKLCMFCGSSGHVVKDCPRASSSKARAVKASPVAQNSAPTPVQAEK